jgi:hypothetical protein
MTLPVLGLPPDQSNYSAAPLPSTVSTQLDGGASRFRADKLGAAIIVTVQWTMNRTNYEYLMAFFRKAINYGADPFTIGLYIDSGAVQDYTCHILPGTLQLSSQQGQTWVVQATLEAIPDVSYASDDADTIADGPDV